MLRQQAVDVEFGLGAYVNLAVGDRRGGEFDGEAGGVAPAGSLAAVGIIRSGRRCRREVREPCQCPYWD